MAKGKKSTENKSENKPMENTPKVEENATNENQNPNETTENSVELEASAETKVSNEPETEQAPEVTAEIAPEIEEEAKTTITEKEAVERLLQDIDGADNLSLLGNNEILFSKDDEVKPEFNGEQVKNIELFEAEMEDPYAKSLCGSFESNLKNVRNLTVAEIDRVLKSTKTNGYLKTIVSNDSDMYLKAIMIRSAKNGKVVGRVPMVATEWLKVIG